MNPDQNCAICGNPIVCSMVVTGNGVTHPECYEREHPPRTATGQTKTNTETGQQPSSVSGAKSEAGGDASDGSGSRLWLVTVEYELLVVADHEREAESVGEYYAGEDGSEPEMVMAKQVRKVEEIPAEWRQCIPFGGDRDDERTCVERVTHNP